jgi:exonuclease SbcC
MKILSVLIENLNSLQGKWYIDFTTQAFVDNGLFAITGPTGAGKSTILDAICIALYHETPRLSSLSKTNAEVMNKDKGYCSAEVRFEVQGQIYLAKWSIRRSRNRADGNLQAPTGTLTCETTQTDITTKLSDKVPAVVALTKLNFKRFTKSMMLSQGEFSAFLNAGDNDRSELLEQLTGTEIYSDISKRVFDEHKFLKQKMALLTTEQSAKDILSDADKTQLVDDIASTQTQFAANNTHLEKLVAHQYWWQQHTQYSIALHEANHHLTEANTAKSEQQDQLAQLNLARPAHKLTPLFTRQTELQQRCDLLQLRIKEQQDQLPALNLELTDAESALKQANADYTQQLARQTTLNQLVNEQVIPLDTNIAAQHKQAAKFAAALAKTNEIIAKTNKDLQTDQSALTHLKSQLKDMDEYLAKHVADGLLAEHIGVWKVEYQSLLTLMDSFTNDSKQLQCVHVNGVRMGSIDDVQSAITKAVEDLAIAVTLSATNTSSDSHDNSSPALLSPISAILDESADISLETLATCIHFYQSQIKLEQELLRLYGQLNDTQTSYHTLTLDHDILQSTLLQQQTQLPIYTQQAQSDKTILELAKNNMSMQQQLATYSQQLTDLDNCPLCASTEFGDYETLHLHTNEQAKDGSFAQQLAQYQTAQQKSSDALNHLTQNIKTQEIMLHKNLTEQDACSAKIHELETQCIAGTIKLGIHLHSKQVEQLHQLPAQLNAFDSIREALTQLHQCIDLASKHHALAKRSTEVTQQQNKILAAVHQVGFIQLESIDTEGIFAAWLNQKSNDLTHWQAQQSQQVNITKSISEITSRIALNQQIVTEAIKVNAQTHAEATVLQDELTANQTQRHALFGSQDPKQAMHDMRLLIEGSNTHKNTQLSKQQTLATKLTSLNTAISKDSEALDQEHLKLILARTQFDEALQASVFASEAEFTQACVSDGLLEQLIELETTINTKLAEATSVLNQAKKNLQQHLAVEQAQYYQTSPSAQVDEQLTHQQQKFATINEQLGQLKGRLAENEKRELAISKIKTQIDALHEEIQTYGYLDELIGSSDGKKFRKFAQGLTLDNLIYLANLQLVDFDGRYELKRKDNQSLDMVVVDRWQGDTERDTRTLSGGESFLVSLALALGLSDLVSQEISIDSLFLDEGFGTLDSDTLDTALDVLDTLNAKGKMIGVISHVEAMKQRIPLQIKITKQSGLGISTLDEQYRYTETSLKSLLSAQ